MYLLFTDLVVITDKDNGESSKRVVSKMPQLNKLALRLAMPCDCSHVPINVHNLADCVPVASPGPKPKGRMRRAKVPALSNRTDLTCHNATENPTTHTSVYDGSGLSGTCVKLAS